MCHSWSMYAYISMVFWREFFERCFATIGNQEVIELPLAYSNWLLWEVAVREPNCTTDGVCS